MLNIEELNKFGAKTDDAIKRCMGNESFYLKLVKMAVADENFPRLDKALSEKDWKESFEAAHALKGVVGNLELTPLYESLKELTDMLRPLEACDYDELLNAVHKSYNELKEIVGD